MNKDSKNCNSRTGIFANRAIFDDNNGSSKVVLNVKYATTDALTKLSRLEINRLIGFSVFLLMLVSTLHGCSSSTGSFLKDKAERLNQVPMPPFSLNVDKDTLVGDSLVVNGHLSAETYWNPEHVSLRLTGLNDGDIVDSTQVLISELGGRTTLERRFGVSVISPSKPIPFELALPARNLTDYQLEVVWGTDVGNVLDPKNKPEKIHLELVNISSTAHKIACAENSCKIYTVRGALYNSGSAVVHGTKIATGFGWLPKNASTPSMPLDEEIIEVPSLTLVPGENRPIEIQLDRPVPPTQDGRFVPMIRIVSAY